MAGTGNGLDSLRPSRFETGRLGLALALSLAAHLAVWGGWEIGRELGIWQRLPPLAWLKPAPKLFPPEIQNQEPPLEFAMVEQPTTEAPKDARYYSSQNSRAANPDANRDEKKPQLNGKQTEVPVIETAPKPDFNKLQPAPQPVNHEPAQQSPPLEPGDLTLANPKDLLPQTQPERPRRLDQVQPHRLPGLPMRQAGGTHREALVPSLDVKATPFGAYDEALIEAVTQRWYDLLDSQRFALDRTGKVVVRFHLNYDGTVTDMSVLQNTVGELLGHVCEDAIHDPAPFAAWPEDMHRLIGRNYREITFTFYYY
jgi:hypothetical protein